MAEFPQWVMAPLLAAVIAALGYVAKLLIEEVIQWRARRSERQSKLLALQSQLLAARVVFEIQNGLAVGLCEEIEAENPDLRGLLYDEVLAAGYPQLNERQKREHGVIRAYTVHAMRPLNMGMIEWLAADTYFKGQRGTGANDDLASKLHKLEAHLLLWRAKYEFWIPKKPERVLVYMADENQHGAEFPKGIEELIARVTGVPVKVAKTQQIGERSEELIARLTGVPMKVAKTQEIGERSEGD
jgi:hypothetical protein